METCLSPDGFSFTRSCSFTDGLCHASEMKSMSVLLYSNYLLPLYEGTDELGEL